ncbi:EPIDERMAL PATTERNING FACTOR-like protein 8 [Macadamia integrifolia]|uniref:EPIDERMAL PATTERNING FACTOR-like protein 8 n=1 Tax=Macadamia integrifolia TaxID=60698 RepID=UPI001C4E6CC0|nr:EPIDERMAL PATTERNING FACTOR-like protein 8 [Macadamia integrifolia]
MASPTKYPNVLRVAVIFLIFFLTLPPYEPVGLSFSDYDEKVKERKQVLGSKPPGCVGKCFSCKPCMAALVIPPHQRQGERVIPSHEEDDRYYLLSWKCTCGDKFFQP